MMEMEKDKNMKNEWQFIADLHTHTVASDHAYSTVLENLQMAKKRGLLALAVTDHGPVIEDSPNLLHFRNLRVLPSEMDGVRLLKGVEANLMDASGKLDLEDDYLQKLDWVIVSFHKEAIRPMSVEENTQAYLNAVRSPWVDMIGHSGSPAFPFDEEAVVREATHCGKVIEVNESSSKSRPGSETACQRIISLCKRYHTRICVDSDAHFCSQVGDFPKSSRMLDELQFPKELVINADIRQLDDYLEERQRQKRKCTV